MNLHVPIAPPVPAITEFALLNGANLLCYMCVILSASEPLLIISVVLLLDFSRLLLLSF